MLKKVYFIIGLCVSITVAFASYGHAEIGQELSVPRHLKDGQEFKVGIKRLNDHGELLFKAMWTVQEGGGRPLTKGVGTPISDPSSPLIFPRNFNRLSAPDANSCAGCHNLPRIGGGGDIVANVFVLGQRFDFATFDNFDLIPTKGCADEAGNPTLLQTMANSRNTLGMFGSGFIEMLARQITVELQKIRDNIQSGDQAEMVSKGILYGTLVRNEDGTWDTSLVEGLPHPSITSSGSDDPPNLIIRPFHQAGAVISLRQFTNNAFNHHHGIQATERFGKDQDPDGDGFVNEMTRADVTAASVWQAQLPVPGRVIPNNPKIEAAVLAGERKFEEIGCAECHIPELPLDKKGWIYTEPNPFNPPDNLRPGNAPTLKVDLTDRRLDQPRLDVDKKTGIVWVPAYTDLKLHDITTGFPDDPNREPLDMLHPAGSDEFFAGNSKFLTRKLWGVANEPPYFHHGKYTTMRQAIENHHGEAESSYQNWAQLNNHEQDEIIEFLKTLQVLPEGTKWLIVDEHGHRKHWPPRGWQHKNQS